MNYRYHPEAQQEFDEQIDEYENKQTGLGLAFMDNILFAVGQIIEQPLAWPKTDIIGVRRRLINQFPFGVIYQYQEEEHQIVIVAIMHQRQKPGYWKNRL